MASTYIYRDYNSAPTNGNKATFSMWVKRGKISSGSRQKIMGAYDGGSAGQYLEFHTDDTIRYHSGSGGAISATNAKFRDAFGWYHIVVQHDTTGSGTSNQVKIYVNGELQSMANNYGASVASQFGKNSVKAVLGAEESSYSSHYYDGIISHFHFIDGTIYAPTVFGSTDSTTGEWKINTSPSVTYGTNGCFLFKDDNSLNDDSTNSNNFTLGNGTFTKTEDSPSNIFATINPLWNHNVSSQNNVVLVQGNTTWYPSSATNNHSWGRSTLGWTSGKYYFEFKIEEVNTGQASGVWMVPVNYPSNSSPQSGTDINYGWQVQYSSSNANFYTTNGGSSVSTITSSLGANPIIMMAIDADNKKMWVGHNGTWWNNNNASTTLNTSYPDHTWTIGTYGDMYQLAFQAYYSSANYNNARANFGNGYFGTTAVSSAGTNASGNGIFEYDVPAGFTALSTKGLNL